MKREEFNELATYLAGRCPDCGTRDQHPTPGCNCPTNESGYGTMHIFKYHHTCPQKKEQNSLCPQ